MRHVFPPQNLFLCLLFHFINKAPNVFVKVDCLNFYLGVEGLVIHHQLSPMVSSDEKSLASRMCSGNHVGPPFVSRLENSQYAPLFTDAVLRFIVDIKPEIDIAIFDKQYFMHFFKLAVDLLFGFEVNWTE